MPNCSTCFNKKNNAKMSTQPWMNYDTNNTDIAILTKKAFAI